MSPQSDGSVKVDVIYLPDADNTYAIDTWSFMSSLAYQTSLDQSGLLNQIEFKQSTTAVGQQVAASGSAMAAQVINLQNAQLLAQQTQMDTAQTAVDQAQTAVSVDQKNLDLLKQRGLADSDPSVVTARSTLALDQVRLQRSTAILDRTHEATRVTNSNAAPGSAISTTPMSTSVWGTVPAWTPPPSYLVPGNRGAGLYCLNEDQAGMQLQAVTLDGSAQGTFSQ